MTILIGFAGYDCASAAEANPSANTASTNTRTCLILALLLRFRRFVILRAEISPVIPARGGIQQLGILGSSTKANRSLRKMVWFRNGGNRPIADIQRQVYATISAPS